MLLLIVSTLFVVGAVAQPACDLNMFYQCQQAFAAQLNIPSQSDANWHNPGALTAAIQNIFINGLPGSANGLVAVCNAYNALIQCLGPMYPSCMNVYFLINNDNSPQNAYGYMSIMNSISFQCGAGFYAAINNWSCIQRVYQHYNDTLYSCTYTFLNNVFHDPDNACSYLQTGVTCATAPFQASCTSQAKWFGCETFRRYFITEFYFCPAQCSVSKLKAEEEYFEQHPEWKNALPFGN